MGGLFEEVVEANGTVKQRSHVGDFLIDERSGPVETPTISRRYLIRDNLGSVSVILDDNLADGLVSSILSSPSYEAFGAEATSTRFNAGADVANMTRGYTDHEQFDDLGIIHMNERIYDADLGRFLSADPLVPHPYFSQSYNRYSYVLNNPLSLTDPTGFEDDKCQGRWGDVPLEWVDENDICIDGNFCNSQPAPVSAPKGPTLISQYTQNPSTRAYHFVEKRMANFNKWGSAPEFSRDWDRQTFANVGSAVAPDAVASGEVGRSGSPGILSEGTPAERQDAYSKALAVFPDLSDQKDIHFEDYYMATWMENGTLHMQAAANLDQLRALDRQLEARKINDMGIRYGSTDPRTGHITIYRAAVIPFDGVIDGAPSSRRYTGMQNGIITIGHERSHRSGVELETPTGPHPISERAGYDACVKSGNC